MPDASATLPSPFSEAGFRAAAASGLRPIQPRDSGFADLVAISGPSDFDLDPGAAADFERHEEPRPAAVLVPVVAHHRLSVLLTQRTDSLPSHAGQIAFPGGKFEPGDADPVATALREAREEIGLDAAFVEPLGYLDPYRTGTGFRIFPVVALVRAGFALSLDRREVADVFEVPLDFLMDVRNHQTHVRTWRGAERRYYAMPFRERYIWGATAGIVKNMHQRLFSA